MTDEICFFLQVTKRRQLRISESRNLSTEKTKGLVTDKFCEVTKNKANTNSAALRGKYQKVSQGSRKTQHWDDLKGLRHQLTCDKHRFYNK